MNIKNCCKKPEVKDLSQGIGPERHEYCRHCKAHYYKGRQYSAKEWEIEFEIDDESGDES